ncbi:hypothetical protein [Muricoccus radiodurans]|uniref:hypothetical protein n=1 Tax=Muricoccus radiodurans TaxID=2231721 RepID=UPI003CE87728
MGRVLLTGFYGRGNAGDEAILQCLYEALAPQHAVAIATHPADTHPSHRDWYPYNACVLVDEGSIGRMLEWDPDALVIGGGGLPPAFGAHLALTMRLLGRPTLLVGTDNLDLSLPNPEPLVLRDYMAGFRIVSLRYERGVQATRALGGEAEHGADWVFLLPTGPVAMAAGQERAPAAGTAHP